ncbi:protein ABIL1 isoform X2 [Cryptomeria japonica]|uniref:protein ABIL1 isoform X2 n=1 Tax=Cryptomeria japonica TaxID=3369 RepID=UPI0025ACA42C|nr:protein ABIL1 isoform X2 [Cryptomeria japonica]
MHSICAFLIHPTSGGTMPMSIAMPDEQPPPSQDEEEEVACLTYEEASMQQSSHFLHNLQELKNLRPQLYSAAEYCELSYVNNHHKPMVVESLKDYVVKALINTVDHLGSVSYKLNDLLSKQINDISSTQLRITCLNQRLLKCQEYIDREGLMQQCLVERSPRYHKHYILPRSVIEESEVSAEKLMETDQYDEQTTPSGVYPEIQGATKANSNASLRDESALMPSAMGPGSFFFLDTEVPIPSVSSQYSRVHSTRLSPGLTTSSSFAAGRRESSRIFKSPSLRLPFGDSHRLDICKPPARSKSLLSFLLNKRKAVKQHISRVS